MKIHFHKMKMYETRMPENEHNVVVAIVQIFMCECGKVTTRIIDKRTENE